MRERTVGQGIFRRIRERESLRVCVVVVGEGVLRNRKGNRFLVITTCCKVNNTNMRI